jgi:hypothetical protein
MATPSSSQSAKLASAQAMPQENTINPLIDDVRRSVCLQAAWEIDALARILPDHVPPDEHQAHMVIRGLAVRISNLAEQLMAGLGDGMVTTREIERRVLGHSAHARHQ